MPVHPPSLPPSYEPALSPPLSSCSAGQEYSYGADMWGFGLSILACALGSFPLLSSQKGSSGGYWGLVHAGKETDDTYSRDHHIQHSHYPLDTTSSHPRCRISE